MTWRYVAALLLVGAAFATRLALDPLFGDRSPFLLFTLVVLIAAGWLGLGPALLAIGLSVLLGTWAFMPPRYALLPLTGNEWTGIAVFVAISGAILILAHQLVRSRRGEAASTEARTSSERREQRLIDAVQDYAIYELDKDGHILTWNSGAERLKGWRADEIIGREYQILHTPEQRAAGTPGRELRIAAETGRFHEEAPRMRKDGSIFIAEVTLFPIREERGDVSGFVKVTRDITERKASEEARALLAREIDHRAKNAMAVAQALVSMTRANSVEQFAQTITGRIAALARAHSLLSRSEWRGAPLDQIIRDELSALDGEQIQLSGPEATIVADAVQPLSLMVHELATNALKHGALSRPSGQVAVRWQLTGTELVIDWQESGGPDITEPASFGFGSRLLTQLAERQLKGSVDFDWSAEGLRARLTLPGKLVTLEQRPAAQEEVPDTSLISAPAAEHFSTGSDMGRILIVEDEELIALAMSAELSRLGWAVVGPAATVREAEALLSLAVDLDAAVLDVNLRGRPVYPLAESLAQRRVPFVFCTGYEMVDPEGKFPDAPIIRKPATAKALSRALSDLLRSRAH
ncbi:MAG TPA: HWE histidine kinase domain-containing protein [Chloroflexota bacterium]|nr:HWE histidine kinase domain-containing protein [Chloroflexota bacterium]